LNIIFYGIRRRISIAVLTKVIAGVIHAYILANDTPAFLPLPLIFQIGTGINRKQIFLETKKSFIFLLYGDIFLAQFI